MSRHKDLIRRMFHDLLESDEFEPEAVARYFSPQYIQRVDGKTLDYGAFLRHVQELKRTLTQVRVIFEEMVEEGNKVMDIHRVEAQKREGGQIAARLMSLWVVEEGRIVLCDEISHWEDGTPEDRDLGSRTPKS